MKRVLPASWGPPRQRATRIPSLAPTRRPAAVRCTSSSTRSNRRAPNEQSQTPDRVQLHVRDAQSPGADLLRFVWSNSNVRRCKADELLHSLPPVSREPASESAWSPEECAVLISACVRWHSPPP